MSDFGVDNVVVEAAKIVIQGRCYQGVLRVGDVFRIVADVRIDKTPDGYGPSGYVNSRPIDLRLAEIHAYGHSFAELHEGMTAELIVIPGGPALPLPRQVLRTT